MTARHVLEELVDESGSALGAGFVIHLTGNESVHLRRILSASYLNPPGADVAVAQADNYGRRFPEDPLRNLRTQLSTEIPDDGAPVVTFAYPENDELDFRDEHASPTVVSDYYDGEFLEYVPASQNPAMPYPHLATTIAVRSGASGGPLFSEGRVVGINCRGWDFDGAEHENANLSYMVPVSEVLDLKVSLSHVPEASWEYQQIPDDRRGTEASLRELAGWGHIGLFRSYPLTARATAVLMSPRNGTRSASSTTTSRTRTPAWATSLRLCTRRSQTCRAASAKRSSRTTG